MEKRLREEPLHELVKDFTLGLSLADALGPIAKSYLPGIGPHEEPETVRLVMTQLLDRFPDRYAKVVLGVPYPDAPRQKCDLLVELEGSLWWIEVKMARFKGNNGKDAEGTVKQLISPYARDHSALSDCTKLASASLQGRKAVLIYGFDFVDRKLDPIVDAFELLANAQVHLGPRHSSEFRGLIHPVHREGRVFAWEILKAN